MPTGSTNVGLRQPFQLGSRTSWIANLHHRSVRQIGQRMEDGAPFWAKVRQ
jgi:hypothetical protein